jgi:hypothetical protein
MSPSGLPIVPRTIASSTGSANVTTEGLTVTEGDDVNVDFAAGAPQATRPGASNTNKNLL